MAFKALLRGFRDLADGSGTAMLDIPDANYPDNTKVLKQKWGYWLTEDEYNALVEGKEGILIAPHLRDGLLRVFESGISLLKEVEE